MRHGIAILVGSAVLCTTLTSPPATAGDPDAAEAQYRVARRLIAEGSDVAADALARVIELDPDGPLADDALVDRALLSGASPWPEDWIALAPDVAAEAESSLAAALEHDGDRAAEARLYRALARLAPGEQFDTAAARVDLVTVDVRDPESVWSRAARYALAWLDEQLGELARAQGGYQRLLVDAAGSETAARARFGLGRIVLRNGDPALAALHLQQVVAADSRDAGIAAELRETAARRVLGRRWDSRSVVMLLPSTGIRSVVGPTPLPDGGVLLGDRRTGELRRLDGLGQLRDRWNLEDLAAVAVGPAGAIYAAAGDVLFRLRVRGQTARLGSLGAYGSPRALAADGLGRVWLLDKRGERIGRLDPGKVSVVEIGADGRARYETLCWDGRRLVALDSRGRRLVMFLPGGDRYDLSAEFAQRPKALAVDRTGRLALVDDKDGGLVLLDAEGRPLERLTLAGVARPVAIAFGWDGSLHLFDGANDAWMKLP